jgi:hypothetical protein
MSDKLLGQQCVIDSEGNKECQQLDEAYDKVKHRKKPLNSLKEAAETVQASVEKLSKSYFESIQERDEVTGLLKDSDKFRKPSKKMFGIFVLCSLVLIAILLGNVVPKSSYEKHDTNYYYVFGFLTLFMLITYVTIPVSKKKTVFQNVIDLCQSRIQNRQKFIEAYTRNIDGKPQMIEEFDEESEDFSKQDGLGKTLKYLWEMKDIKNMTYLYAYYTVHNVVFLLLFLLFFFFVIYKSAPWYSIFYYPLVVLFYFYHLTHWITLFNVYAQSANEIQAEKEAAAKKQFFYFSNLWLPFVVGNSFLLLSSFAIFITFLFQNSSLASWTMISVIGFIAFMVYFMLEGETLGEKLTYLGEMHKKTFLHMTTLVMYMMFFVFYMVTPMAEMPDFVQGAYGVVIAWLNLNPLPIPLTSIFASFYKYFSNEPFVANGTLSHNLYAFIGFPLIIFYALYCFYRATFAAIPKEDGETNYNAIRIRYLMIYFLAFVFFATLYSHQTKIPCYVQKMFDTAMPHTKAIYNCVICMFVFGFITLISVINSPAEFFKLSKEKVAEREEEKKKKPKDPKIVTSIDEIKAGDDDDGETVGSYKRQFLMQDFDTEQTVKFTVVGILLITIIVLWSMFSVKYIATKRSQEAAQQNANKDPSKFMNASEARQNANLAFLFIFTIFVVFVFILYLGVSFFRAEATKNDTGSLFNSVTLFFMIAGILGFVITLLIFVYYTLITPSKQGFGRNLVAYFIVFLIFYLMFKVLESNDLYQKNPYYQLFVQGLFLIPCKIEEIIVPKIVNSVWGAKAYAYYKATDFNTPSVYIAIALLLATLLFMQYGLLPFLQRPSTMFGGILLMNGPYQVTDEPTLAYPTLSSLNSQFTSTSQSYNTQSFLDYYGNTKTSSDIALNTSSSYSNIFNPNYYTNKYTYALTFWFNVPNVQTGFEKEPLINFGGVPEITYVASSNMLYISFATGVTTTPVTTIKIPNIKLQKWNFVEINVDGGNVDIFINAQLIKSKKGIIPASTTQTITVGSKQFAGSTMTTQICNFVYYPKVLTIVEINLLYTMNKNNNPPTSTKVNAASSMAEYVTYMSDAEMKFDSIKNTFACSYVDFIPPVVDVCNNITNDNTFTNFLSLPWYFKKFGDNVTGLF